MKNFCLCVALICMALSAQAFQTVELKEVPPLEPLHWCKDSEGKVQYQREACGSDTTEVSSISTTHADGTVTHEKLGATLDSPNETPAAKSVTTSPEPEVTASANSANNGDDVMKKWRKSMFKMLGLALLFGVIAKLTGRSFLRWFFVGFGAYFLLVVANVFPG